jgi:acyl-CoA dehydrogenase
MGILIWLVLLVGTLLTLAYRRTDLRTATVVLGTLLVAYLLFGSGGFLWNVLLIALFVLFALANIEQFRRDNVTRRLFALYRSMLPSMSKTEQEALEAGSVWWDGELFTGMPDWRRLKNLPAAEAHHRGASVPRRSDRAALRSARRMADHARTRRHAAARLAVPEGLQVLRDDHPEEYGGLQFSPLACSMVLAKLSSRSTVAARRSACRTRWGRRSSCCTTAPTSRSSIGCRVSRAARKIPCFALTVAARRLRRDRARRSRRRLQRHVAGPRDRRHRLNWDKRYITLAPIATVLGLAFKLYDPEHLIGEVDAYGITAALIPMSTPGIEIGRRHFRSTFHSRTARSRRDVFVPLETIIGGTKMAGQGWHMLVQQLAVGRSIVAAEQRARRRQAALYATGAYAKLRGSSTCRSASSRRRRGDRRMAGNVYTMMPASRVTCTAITNGESPPCRQRS